MDSNFRGNPAVQLGPTVVPKMPKRKVRCLVADWYTGDGAAVAEEGKTYSIDLDVARALVKFGRAAYAN